MNICTRFHWNPSSK